MFTYWELYVAYVNRCVEDNWKNDIDPHHYRMEWNHFLPKCIFGDWPIGHYLTLRQHAIASALQSLAFNRNCMCAWHKKHLPELLLEIAWPIYCEAKKRNGMKLNQKIHEEKDYLGRSVHSVKAAEKAHTEKDELGRSVLGVKNGERLNQERDDFGRSVQGVKNGKRLNELKCRTVKLTRIEDGETFIFSSIRLAARTLKVHSGNLGAVCKGKLKRVGQYTAEYWDG